ncbi:hypothetical protein R5R35_010428 [Gryllus longicercus]|uniref:Uncharacterized protein n=1 Tax=Gryllus longicercus TaxID=2509291 RepID=A0AAN9Z3B8_9ORTH
MNTAWLCRWKHVVSRAADALPPPRPGPGDAFTPGDPGAGLFNGGSGERRAVETGTLFIPGEQREPQQQHTPREFSSSLILTFM